jgi:tetratricopeptide (TPR) repeat protein
MGPLLPILKRIGMAVFGRPKHALLHRHTLKVKNGFMKDARGLEVTSDDAAAVAAEDDFAARLLRLDQGAEAILDASTRWPDTPIIQLYAAAFWLYGQTTDALASAASRLQACRGLAMNARERALCDALTRWLANDDLRAVEAMEAITAAWPGDLCTAKFAEFLYYVLGQQHMGPRFLAHMTRLEPVHAGDPDFLAMAGFASELCDDFAAAEKRAERALAIEARNPWAQHALSHVLIRQGRIREGLARMEAFLPLLATCARPIHSHDAWHLALLQLEELDIDATMRVFRDHIWGITPDLVVEQLDAIALLWRIEMAGTAMDAEWASIAEHLAPRASETFMPFMNAHYVYALARAGRSDDVAAVLAAVRERSARDDEEAKRVWAPVGRAMVEAAAAFGTGERARAAALLDPVMPMMTWIGGSDAQDDLFRQAYLRSLQAAGRHADAAAYFERMTTAKARTPLDRVLAS